jgi:hypothetical protein
MRRGAIGFLILGLAGCALGGCFATAPPGLKPPRLPCDRDDRLIGTWTSGVHMSQLGPGFETLTYNCDCTFKGRSMILMLIVPVYASGTGWYTAADGKLATDTGSGRTESSYKFEGKTLVIQQGASVMRYHQARHRSCKGRAAPPR